MQKLSMGEYGFEVWASYGVALVLLVAVSYVSIREWRKARAALNNIDISKP